MRDDDYMAVRRGGLFLETELEGKRSKMEAIERKPFLYVRLAEWKVLALRGVEAYRRYHGEVEEDLHVDSSE
jgi:hypothetical protein